uniref:Uncharacterized protein n=1 Tax=Physcomitrium patens TaxID=3218 RepID=A0A2K1JBH5_PHYPA|nr:hypothetical protein PHYPA_019157 [Physcomitrium patens]
MGGYEEKSQLIQHDGLVFPSHSQCRRMVCLVTKYTYWQCQVVKVEVPLCYVSQLCYGIGCCVVRAASFHNPWISLSRAGFQVADLAWRQVTVGGRPQGGLDEGIKCCLTEKATSLDRIGSMLMECV